MLTFLKVMAFNGLVVLFFWYVGNSIPQQRKDPPKESTLTADMAPEVFVAAGQDIFYGKGTCALCHTIGEKGERCPNLAGIGQRAGVRVEEASYQGDASNGAEYVVESLHNPAVYVVDGYQPTMPALGRQLNDLEIVAVVAFMQSLGGEVTVTGETLFPKYRADSGAARGRPPGRPLQWLRRRAARARSWWRSGDVSVATAWTRRFAWSGPACGTSGRARTSTSFVSPFSSRTPWWRRASRRV